VGAVIEARLAAHGLRIQLPLLVELQVRIHSAHAIGSRNAGIGRARRIGHCVEFAVGVDESEVTSFVADFAAHPQDAEIRLPSPQRIVRRDALAWRLIIRKKRSDGPRAFLSRQPNSVQRIGNATREYQVDRGRKISGILLEKWPLLGK
jgi:hypothetical protein